MGLFGKIFGDREDTAHRQRKEQVGTDDAGQAVEIEKSRDARPRRERDEDDVKSIARRLFERNRK